MNNESENLSFFATSVGDQVFNVNQDIENNQLNIITNFDAILPYMNEDNGLFIKNKNKEILLSPDLANYMLIKADENTSDVEYLKMFCEKKNNFLKIFLNNIYAQGFQVPSVAQSITLEPLIQRRDSIIQFKSGTGKTLSFLIGSLWHFDPEDKRLQHVFITSSHEVAKQIHSIIYTLLPKTCNVVLCIGQKKESGGFKQNSENSTKSEYELAHSAQIIVATMGKFYDLVMNRKIGRDKKPVLNLDSLKSLIIDEFDVIIGPQNNKRSNVSMISSDISSDKQIEIIITTKLPKDTQRIFFSASITESTLDLAYLYLRTPNNSELLPFIVVLNPDDYTLNGIRQFYVEVGSIEHKKDTLFDLLTRRAKIDRTIIFVNTIHTANMLKNFLETREIPMISEVFHRDLSSQRREEIRLKMLQNEVRILISTDVLARGFDLQTLKIVFNYDMPNDSRTYIHRIGRSGRHGRKGVAISFIEVNPLKNINEMLKVQDINLCSKVSKMEVLPEDFENYL